MRTMSKVAIFATCAVLPLLIAATMGGLPSTPRFQHVTVASTQGRKISLIAADTFGDNYIQGFLVDGTTPSWYVGNGLSVTNDVLLANQVSGSDIRLDTAGLGAVRINNSIVPRVKSARVGSGGSLSGGVGVTSAVRNGVGDYTVTWSSPVFTGPPSCTVTTSQNLTPGSAELGNHTPGTGSLSVHTLGIVSGAFAAADMNFHVICVQW